MAPRNWISPNTRRGACAALLLAAATLVHAHAHLKEAMPADGSTLMMPPSRIALHFSEAARLTAAWIQKGGEARRKLAPLPARSAAEIDVPLPPLTPGHYVVSWRVLSDDGHIVPGQLRFTLLPSAPGGTPHP
ncbi:MAG TPA: copper resistance CopC family protein [Steroidobacteraceae bacterium]|nr:copper resistance CopC family protein [Steroidobacteraceae bacterium]